MAFFSVNIELSEQTRQGGSQTFESVPGSLSSENYEPLELTRKQTNVTSKTTLNKIQNTHALLFEPFTVTGRENTTYGRTTDLGIPYVRAPGHS